MIIIGIEIKPVRRDYTLPPTGSLNSISHQRGYETEDEPRLYPFSVSNVSESM
jgi:hypothetical protein